MLLYGRDVTLRPATAEDVPRLAGILAEPEVARWWPRYDEARLRHDLLDRPDLTAFAIEVEGELAGCAQYHEESGPFHRHATVDLFLAPAWQGKGLGTDALRTLARHLFHDRGHHRLTVDPPAVHLHAIRTYQRVGFKPVGVMRQYERNAQGEWQDGLLMDLLPRDLQ
jgi:aminoglycoside 6'-N-acetyltransferase